MFVKFIISTVIERFSMSIVKLNQITESLWHSDYTDNPVNQSKLEASARGRCKARENVCERIKIGLVLVLIT